MLQDPQDYQSSLITLSVRRNLLSLTAFRNEIRKLKKDLSGEKAELFSQLSTTLATLREEVRKQILDFVRAIHLEPAPQVLTQKDITERTLRQEVRSILAEILYSSSDAQALAGR